MVPLLDASMAKASSSGCARDTDSHWSWSLVGEVRQAMNFW